MIKTQIFLGDKPTKKKFHPIKDHPRAPANKPVGGLWTTDLDGNTCAWKEWCEAEDFKHSSKMWALEIDQKAKVLVIDKTEDLAKIIETYSYKEEELIPKEIAAICPHELKEITKNSRLFKFEPIAKEYDIIQLTVNGYETMGRYNFESALTPPTFNLWDVPCLLIMNFDCITSVKRFKP